MFVCNMVGSTGLRSKSGKVKLNQEDTVSATYFTQEGYSLVQTDGAKGEENVFAYGLSSDDDSKVYRVGKPHGRKGSITYKMIKDTEENPLIIVLCNEIGIYEGVEADIRFIVTPEGYILAMLVSGVCSFDGNPMQRCNTVNFDGRKIYSYNAEKLTRLSDTLFTENNSGYVYSNDIICSVLLNHESDSAFSAKRVGNPYFLDKTNYDNALEKYHEDKRLKEIEAERIRLEKAEREERVRAEREAKELAKAKELAEKRSIAARSAKLPKEETKSVGAADFLAAMRNLQQ